MFFLSNHQAAHDQGYGHAGKQLAEADPIYKIDAALPPALTPATALA